MKQGRGTKLMKRLTLTWDVFKQCYKIKLTEILAWLTLA